MSHMHKIRGFTLIEVMVAVVILAIGLLGMATLMMQSLQSSESAYSRSQATVLAYDIIERMRANKVQDPAAPYQSFRVSQATISSDYVLASPNACPNSECSNCDGKSKAISDLSQWCQALSNSMPNALPGTQITRDAATNQYSINVQWQEPDGNVSSVFVEAEL